MTIYPPPIVAISLWLTSTIATIIVAVDTSPADPIALLTSLGFPGVVIILFITGKLRWDGEVKRLVQELDKKDKIIEAKDIQLAKLQDGVVEQVIPALTRSSQIIEWFAANGGAK